MKKIVGIILVLVSLATISFAQTLGQALNTNLTWTTSSAGGAGIWTGQTSVYHVDGAAAASGSLRNSTSATSTLQTIVVGPGTLTFWWKVSSGLSLAGFDAVLDFEVNGSQQNVIEDDVDWEPEMVYLAAGQQTLQWVSSQYSFQFAANGYVDDVTWTAGATVPTITSQPAGQSEVIGLNATFRVGAVGTPPLIFQWRFNGTNILGATNSSYVVTNVQNSSLGNYDVVITNSTGTATSSIAPLVAGQITSWGDFTAGETYVPVNITNALMVVGGFRCSLVLNQDGSVTAWGDDSSFQTNLPLGLTNVIALAASATHCLALKADGRVMAWGTNYAGETIVPIGLSNVVAVAAGTVHSMALKSDGTIIAWGDNSTGQTNVPNNLTNVVAISANGNDSEALTADGIVSEWGYNDVFGETSVPPDLTNAVAIANGGDFSSALRSDGTVVAWGMNLLNWTNVPSGLSNVVAISASDFVTAALKSDGTVIAWGDNTYGATNIPAGLTNVMMIGTGRSDILAVIGGDLPVTQASIQNPTLSTNGFSLSIPTQCGHVYRLEYQTNLGVNNWASLPLVAGNGTNLVLVDPNQGVSQRFYRVRRW